MNTDTLSLAPRMVQHQQPDRLVWDCVDLSVTNLDRSLQFWTGALGFHQRPGEGPGVALGTRQQTLVVLHNVATIPVQRGHAGMYHVAFGVSCQAEFSRLLARFVQLGLRVSLMDHTRSKAIYLNDPDGHGIEVALETPDRFARFAEVGSGLAMIDHRGTIRTGREPLDREAELAFAQGADLAASIADSTDIAHLHLHVPDLDGAVAWFEGIGFSRNLVLPKVGMADMGAGTMAHRLAVNVWAGKNVSPAPANSARLLGYRIAAQDPAVFEGVGAGLAQDATGRRWGRDPAGIAVTLVQRHSPTGSIAELAEEC